MTVHHLSRTDARRIAVRAQLLTASRPDGLLDLLRHVTLLQADATAAVAPNADLIAWSRLGSAYDPAGLQAAVSGGSIVELEGMLRPAEDLALFRAEMAAWPGVGPLSEGQEWQSEWMSVNEDCRREILEQLFDDGPLPARALHDTTVVPWRSSGWNDNRNIRMMLALMVRRGEVAAAGRDGRDRLWDLAERVYPDDPPVPFAEADRIRAERRLRSLGIARARGPECQVEPQAVGEVGEPAVVEGVRGTWRIDPAYLDLPFTGRAALLSPLDRLVFDRKRMLELFEFDYQLEMYKPAAKRRWGYFALPVLYGDRLVGKLDATADRSAGVLRVDAIHQDVTFSRTMAARIGAQIEDLARWLQLRLALPG